MLQKKIIIEASLKQCQIFLMSFLVYPENIKTFRGSVLCFLCNGVVGLYTGKIKTQAGAYIPLRHSNY